ncbi:SDR family NAD(P)-dependent oxidoreductase [Geminicoccus roseus]|uniref:SDR family NAD(P)-dependent oxidoreductase n=1 Tax=Geminicoccus roseus TaxID=404900 RepID=UPI0004184480|nr:SDR family NAD(P)-dependent oxidoreductase [Geminicoccus roseus]
MRSIVQPSSAVVVGASGGIGQALVERLLAEEEGFGTVFALSRRPKGGQAARRAEVPLDLENEDSIRAAAARVAEAGPVGLVIVATGMLHEGGRLLEKSFKQLDPGFLERTFRINTIGPALVAKHFLPLLPRQGRAVFAALSARVGSITDNELGGWYGYRASKAALNMLIRSLSIELARTHPLALCVGLHPGTVATGLSQPFQAGVPQGRLFTPDHAAQQLLDVLDGLQADDSGHCHAWDGARIPP